MRQKAIEALALCLTFPYSDTQTGCEKLQGKKIINLKNPLILLKRKNQSIHTSRKMQKYDRGFEFSRKHLPNWRNLAKRGKEEIRIQE